MITVRQGSKHHNKLKRSDNDVDITLLSPLFISVKIINILLLLSFCFYDKQISKFVGYLSVGNASKRYLLITNSTKHSNLTSLIVLSVILDCLAGCFFLKKKLGQDQYVIAKSSRRFLRSLKQELTKRSMIGDT